MQSNIEETTPSFTRRSVMKAAGMATVGFGAIAAGAGTAAASVECDYCVPVGKIEGAPKVGTTVYTFEKYGETLKVEVTVDPTADVEDGEVVGFDWNVLGGESDTCLTDAERDVCRVDIKGGPGTDVRSYCDGSGGGSVKAPRHDRSPNRDFYEISNFTFYFCYEENDCAGDASGDSVDCDASDLDRPANSRGRGR